MRCGRTVKAVADTIGLVAGRRKEVGEGKKGIVGREQTTSSARCDSRVRGVGVMSCCIEYREEKYLCAAGESRT